MVKRLIEIVLALILLVPVTFVSMLLMVFIRLDTPGFPLVFQKRLGRNEKTFTCLKLRTFEPGSEIVATHEAQANQITAAGRILRPLHLDELPQIWNVLVGDMSFVGPRPCLSFMSDVIEARRALNIWSLRPGITGIAQLEDIDMRYPNTVAQLDAVLLQNHSLWLEFRVCLSTVFPFLWRRWRHIYVPHYEV